MSFITKWAFRNKAAVVLIATFVLIMGIVSYIRLPVEFLPPADQPFISICLLLCSPAPLQLIL
jgi:multidrug efflux pump subunit AcrB